MTEIIFITGTDTDVGKTYVTIKLIELYNHHGYKTIGLKPIASGTNANGFNEDVLKLQSAASIQLNYSEINYFSFINPISPNIAANQAGINLTTEKIYNKMLPIFNYNADIIFIEGIGGWHCPINETETMADLVMKLNIPVVLVIGIKLGCLNHSILTHQAIINSNLNIKGWVANCIDPKMEAIEGNIETLKNYLNSPFLGKLQYK